ncbi:hypothetical protein B0H15DRAFT_989198 [Mycena belliarum]|uniref:NAD(P)-binding protein n=1 Tax=Mycena belliarum TaxID=1033014 RepID=A0AAD6TZ85_9AGAR|nr:hypothetical protein B0H15DRAFT_989198 [Mycena belliae]
MSPTSNTVYFVTGANRGIGYALAATLAARPNTTVFAGARDPAAQSLKDLAAKHPNVHALKVTNGDVANNEAAISEIKRIAGRLDVLIPNAGMLKYMGPLATTPPAELRAHWEVNTLGLLVLFQAAHALLLASPTHTPVLAYISSASGSIGKYGHYFGTSACAYGSSKAAANFLVKVLDAEHPQLVAMAIHPGWVATDMGNVGAEPNGMSAAPVTVDDSVQGILSRIDGATKEKSSGRFWNFAASNGGNVWDNPTEELTW